MPFPDVAIREIGPEDRAELARFLEENDRPEIVRTFNPFPMTAATAERIAAAPRRDRYYGAFDDGRLVALSMLRGWDEGYDVPSFGIVACSTGPTALYTVSSMLRISPRSTASPTVVDTKLFVTLNVMSTRAGSPHSATM